jgi:hypothetical protein
MGNGVTKDANKLTQLLRTREDHEEQVAKAVATEKLVSVRRLSAGVPFVCRHIICV